MTTTFFEALAAPFPPERISWRVGATNREKTKGMALAYIDSRDVQVRLDEVCTPAGWQSRFPHANGKTICEVGILIDEQWIWKSDGAGDTDVEAEKGAISSAFKRAAVHWGVGRYLYDVASPWVALDEHKRIVPEEHKKLEELLARYTVEVEWGTPAERAAIKAMVNDIRSMLHTADDVRIYREKNEGVIAQLRVAARALVNKSLTDIEEASGAVSETFRGDLDRRGPAPLAGRSTGQPVNA